MEATQSANSKAAEFQKHQEEWRLALAMVKTKKGSPLSGRVMMVAMALQSFENRETRLAYPSHETLGFMAGYPGKASSVATEAGRAIKVLEDADMLERAGRFYNGSNKYRLVVPETAREGMKKAQEVIQKAKKDDQEPESVLEAGASTTPEKAESVLEAGASTTYSRQVPDRLEAGTSSTTRGRSLDITSEGTSEGTSEYNLRGKSEARADVDEAVPVVDAEGSSENDFQEEEPISTEDWEAVADFDSLPKTPHLATAGATFAPDRQKPLDPDDETPPF